MFISCGGGPSIEGSWAMESVSGEELSEREKAAVFTFHGDGTITVSMDGREEKGTWKWTEDKKDIILQPEGRKEETMMGVTIEGDLLKFKSKDNDIVLKRK